MEKTTRLIDATAPFHVVAGHHDLYKGATLRTDKARRDELLQVMVDINEAPTVEAIPVEWLFDWRNRALKEGMNLELVKWIEYILQIWSRESEAR